jgi:hypothetical protein
MGTKVNLRMKMMLAATGLVVPIITAGGVSAAVSQETLEDLCERTSFYRSEIRRMQRSDDFPEIVEYTLANCPAVMAALTSEPTATFLGEKTDRRDDKTRETTDNGGEKKTKKKEKKKENEKEEEKEEEKEKEGEKPGPGKREDGPGKREDGPGKRENGPGKRDDGPGKREDGPGKKGGGEDEQSSEEQAL